MTILKQVQVKVFYLKSLDLFLILANLDSFNLYTNPKCILAFVPLGFVLYTNPLHCLQTGQFAYNKNCAQCQQYKQKWYCRISLAPSTLASRVYKIIGSNLPSHHHQHKRFSEFDQNYQHYSQNYVSLLVHKLADLT